MPISRPPLRFARGHLLSASAALLLAACVADPVTPPLAPDEGAAFGKAAGGPTVSSTLPRSGEKGQTLDVHVYGTGFAAGAVATWALHGAADPTKVRTNSTTVVSSTELIANITIAPDATIDYWDVQVTAAFCCKTGIGTEMFEVTSAMPVGPGIAYGVNDAGDIVGGYAFTPTSPHAFVVSGADGSFTDLGPQRARGVSPDGLLVVGGVSAEGGTQVAGVWTRSAGGPWPVAGTPLPGLGGVPQSSGVAFVVGTIPAEGVTVVAGVPLPATPTYWESTDGTWATATARTLPVPAGYATTVNSILGISATGDIAGQLNDPTNTSVAVVWRRVAGSYVAEVLPRATGWDVARLRSISPDGTILAGNLRQTVKGKQVLAPAYWTRDASGAYSVRLLPSLTGSYGVEGAVYGVTVVGGQVRAVGTSPGMSGGSFVHGVMWTWTPGATDFQVRDIGGVGTKTDVTPYAINPAGTIAVGADGTGSIEWQLLP